MSRPVRNVRVALTAAAFLALLEMFRSGMTRIVEGQRSSVFDLLHWVIPLWVGVVLVSPWCAFMAWRFPVRNGQLTRTSPCSPAAVTAQRWTVPSAIWATCCAQRSIRPAGVGLANTRERLALLHGAVATLECSDAPEGGGIVRIVLPWRTAMEPGA